MSQTAAWGRRCDSSSAKRVDAGILHEASGYKRNRIFVAHEVLQALEQTR